MRFGTWFSFEIGRFFGSSQSFSGVYSKHLICSITYGPPHWGTIFITLIFIKFQKGVSHHCLDNRSFMLDLWLVTWLLWGAMRTNIFYQAGSNGSPIASTICSLLQAEGGHKELFQLLPVLPFHNTLIGYQLASIQCVVEKQGRMSQLIHEAFQIISKVKALCNGPEITRQVGNLHQWYHMSFWVPIRQCVRLR